MARFHFKQIGNYSKKHESSAESVIQELKDKMSRLKFRLFDCQNRNQMLRKELLLARKVIKTEVTEASDESIQELLNQTDFRGRQEEILILKDKIAELQSRIKQMESTEKSSEDMAKSSKFEKQVCKTYQNKKMIDKELQYLLENSCQIKRKVELWKKRNAGLNKEIELLRLELDRLLEKGNEDKSVLKSYHVVDKELRSRQSEKLGMRSKLDWEKTRNEQLSEESLSLKENLSIISSKINDDKVLVDALKNQQGYLLDLLERQRSLSESENRKFQDDMGEIQAKHATNNHVLDHLKDIINGKTQVCQQVKNSMKRENAVEEEVSSIVTMSNSDLTLQSESQQSSVPANEHPSDTEDQPMQSEMSKLKEDVGHCKSIFHSVNEEVEQLVTIIVSNNKKINEWMNELFKTNSSLAQKNAEIRELEHTLKKLQKCSAVDIKESASTLHAAEIQKKNDVLTEEYQFLLILWDLLISSKENNLEVYFVSVEFERKQFMGTLLNLTSEEDEDDVPYSTENEELS